jgi:hypothetical protein
MRPELDVRALRRSDLIIDLMVLMIGLGVLCLV